MTICPASGKFLGMSNTTTPTAANLAAALRACPELATMTIDALRAEWRELRGTILAIHADFEDAGDFEARLWCVEVVGRSKRGA